MHDFWSPTTLACLMTTLQRSIKKGGVPRNTTKVLKQNAATAKSPTRTLRTQGNHIFASIMAYVKLENLKFSSKLNHFAIKSKIYLAANKAAFKELAALKAQALSA